MPVIYLPKDLYDKLILRGEDPPAYVSKAAEEKLARECNGKGKLQSPEGG